MTSAPLRVGILGADSEAIQTIYLPILQSLRQYFEVTVLHSTLSAATATDTPRITSSIDDVINDPSVTLILNFMPNEYHEAYTIAALEAGKHVMVETPLSLSIRSTRRILEAEKRAPNHAKVFVACARRHAPCLALFKSELAALDRIYYARCRNIAGPHPAHSATASSIPTPTTKTATATAIEPKTDPADTAAQQLRQSLLEEVFSGQDLDAKRISLCQFLASLGCHDLGLMRDTLGAPDTISTISVNDPFYSAIFHYTGPGRTAAAASSEESHPHPHPHPHPFTLVYEAGADSVPRCDAHLAIYGRTKTLSVYYDLPYARGWRMSVVVEERDERGELKVTESVSSWEDGYREELKALYAYLVEGTPVKMTAADGIEDLRLFRMMFEQYDRQCGTIRTPLG